MISTAIYACEHCGSTEKGNGYDDEYFHSHVIPSMKCKNCGKIADANYTPQTTKYPDGWVV